MDALITTENAARALGIRPQTLRAALCRNQHYFGLKPVKMPNRLLLWRREDIDRLIDSRTA